MSIENLGAHAITAVLESREHLDEDALGDSANHAGDILRHATGKLRIVLAALYGEPMPTREDVLLRMRPYIEAELARGTALKHISRHLLGLYQGEPGARGFRRRLSEGAHLPGADWALMEQAIAQPRIAA